MMQKGCARVALYLVSLWEAVRRDERGQGLVEYAAILGFLAAVVVVAVHFFEPAVATSLNNVANSF
jgi:Flp pilus assembly pilin Flp